MTELEIIQEFESAQCSDKGTVFEAEINDKKRTGLDCGIIVYFPIHWQSFNDLIADYVEWNLIQDFVLDREEQQAHLGLIFWGEPSDAVVERIFMSRFEMPEFPFVPAFIDVKARVQFDSLFCRGWDGLDLGRSFQNVMENGLSAEPIWQWDK